MVDPNIPRFSQGMVVLVTAPSFLVDVWYPIPLLAVVLAAGSLWGIRAMLFGQVYLSAVRPLLGIGPPSQLEPAAPPRFAQTLGAIFLAAASVAFLAGAGTLGWALVLIVTALALLAVTTGLCVGCEIYLLIARTRGRTA